MLTQFFWIPAARPGAAAEALNGFVRSHRVLSVQRELVVDGPNSAWAVLVTYVEGDGRPPSLQRGRVDYREVLSEPDFAVYARLRALRKETAEREGVPAYAVFTNEQLADMVRKGARSMADLRAIEGVGESRARKFGAEFLAALAEQVPDPPSDGERPRSEERSDDTR